jgi:hypothetical protein
MGDKVVNVYGVDHALKRYSSHNIHVPLSFVDDPPLVYPIDIHCLVTGISGTHKIHLIRLLVSQNIVGIGDGVPNVFVYLEHAVFVPYGSQTVLRLERSDISQVSTDVEFYEMIDGLPGKTWKVGFPEAFEISFWEAVYTWKTDSAKSRAKSIRALGIFEDVLFERKSFLKPPQKEKPKV